MPVMEKLRMFVAQEPVVAASCLIGGVGLFLPAVVRPILDSLEASKQVKAPPLTDVSIYNTFIYVPSLCYMVYIVLMIRNLMISPVA
ncbi:unnamed protein product [Brassica rapa]|uniref:Fiber protein Fb11 n=4 Tax=Brassica TaxID=3705 RepID=A0A8D9DCQ0_BRACM|nr:unnamed protein product [Brassica napus]CAG7873611.1 unnamed protein product [Brassica rapa]